MTDTPRSAATADSRVDVDLLVVGSGGAGLTAALTAAASGLDTLVVEKAGYVGGTTTLSGGAIWAPNAPALVAAGQAAAPEDVVTYLRAVTSGEVADDRLQAFVDATPEMMALLERSPHVSFEWCSGYPDYYPHYPHGSAVGRSVEATPLDRRTLGDRSPLLREPALRTPRGMWMRAVDLHDLVALRRSLRGKRMMARMLWRAATSWLTRRQVVTRGEALVGRLLLALDDAQVPLWLDAPMTRLMTEGDAVVGAVVVRGDEVVEIRARHGVVIASGGFDHDPALRAAHQPFLVDHVSAGAPENTGDGITAGTAVGGATDLMDEAWWMPTITWPEKKLGLLLVERQIAAQLTVDHGGRRFTNEAAPYTDFVRALIDAGCTRERPAWLVIDSRAWRSNLFGTHLPLPRVPAPVETGRRVPQAWLDSGAVRTGSTWAELAAATGLDPATLQESAERFNRLAADGRDTDFHRGENAYDNYYGDHRLPNPNLRPLTEAPFYAFAVAPSDLGTKGGLVTDAHGRVLRDDGSVVPGLYAAGNASASVMGRSYPGPGGTIAPAMTFGYLAARHAAQNADGQRG
jgi:glycine/D-amino acid oxidase-like deaminating enzyme